jgi:hypothetical protein
MMGAPDIRDLHDQELAYLCLTALTRLVKLGRPVYWIGWIEDEVSFLSHPTVHHREQISHALAWLTERGFTVKPAHDMYAITGDGEVVHTVLAYERLVRA